MKEIYKRDLGFLEAALACGANVPGNYSNGHLRSLFQGHLGSFRVELECKTVNDIKGIIMW